MTCDGVRSGFPSHAAPCGVLLQLQVVLADSAKIRNLGVQMRHIGEACMSNWWPLQVVYAFSFLKEQCASTMYKIYDIHRRTSAYEVSRRT